MFIIMKLATTTVETIFPKKRSIHLSQYRKNKNRSVIAFYCIAFSDVDLVQTIKFIIGHQLSCLLHIFGKMKFSLISKNMFHIIIKTLLKFNFMTESYRFCFTSTHILVICNTLYCTLSIFYTIFYLKFLCRQQSFTAA